uniref:Ig-like domain-containing protein n=1 Tax=Neogobius melanostomus TaxID=47308 RepID=A0A8C6WX96_9GOBI
NKRCGLLNKVCLLFMDSVTLCFVTVVSSNTAFYRAVIGSDVILRCLFTELPLQQSLSKITVEWYRVDANRDRNSVYTFEDGRALVKRVGAEVNQTRLLHSDASLTLRNVTVRDEGTYTCRIITPVVETVTNTLKVFGMDILLSTPTIIQV